MSNETVRVLLFGEINGKYERFSVHILKSQWDEWTFSRKVYELSKGAAKCGFSQFGWKWRVASEDEIWN